MLHPCLGLQCLKYSFTLKQTAACWQRFSNLIKNLQTFSWYVLSFEQDTKPGALIQLLFVVSHALVHILMKRKQLGLTAHSGYLCRQLTNALLQHLFFKITDVHWWKSAFFGGKGQLCFYYKNRICSQAALPLFNRTLSARQHFGDLSEGSKC